MKAPVLHLAGELLLAVGMCTAAAAAEPPAPFCASVQNDDRMRPLPQSLLPAARAALAISAPDDVMQAATVFRCMAGKVMVCFVGANLPCGERQGQEAPSGGAAGRWCVAHPDASFVPKVVTGGSMIGNWHCSGTKAVLSPGGEAVDRRGFVARIWKTLR